MIQLALRSSIQAEAPIGSARSARIDGSATAVIISSSPARKTPVPNTIRSTIAERRSIRGGSGGPASGCSALDGPGSRVQRCRRRLPMSRPKPPRAERNAGAFMGPDVMIPVPMRTLSDDYRDEPAEPEDTDRIPEPEPSGLVRRVLDRITSWGQRG
jgi:hypothetical protein